jgi:methylated-DNA-protein-cysteine methyltransferase-like protein
VSTGLHQRIHAIVSRIPRGRVATYGQVARLSGRPGHARLVGYALSALRDDSPVPWHRVVNAAGELSPRSGGKGIDLLQRARLESEGVRFDERGRIGLARFRWRPRRFRVETLGSGTARRLSARPENGRTA